MKKIIITSVPILGLSILFLTGNVYANKTAYCPPISDGENKAWGCVSPSNASWTIKPNDSHTYQMLCNDSDSGALQYPASYSVTCSVDSGDIYGSLVIQTDDSSSFKVTNESGKQEDGSISITNVMCLVSNAAKSSGKTLISFGSGCFDYANKNGVSAWTNSSS